MKNTVLELIKHNITISTMESCTGGAIANAITNVEGASDIFEYSAITYSNQSKIKMGVPAEIIEKYSVYSKEVAREMAKSIAKFSNSRLGIGVTGRLNREDKNNVGGDTSSVYVAIYDSVEDSYYETKTTAKQASREDNKRDIVDIVSDMIMDFVADYLSK